MTQDVYVLWPDPNVFHSLVLADPRHWDTLARFDGRRQSSWTPIEVEIYPAERRGDCPGFTSHVPVLSERAWNTLAPLIDQEVQALELRASNETYYALNVLTVLDCLDADASDIDR